MGNTTRTPFQLSTLMLLLLLPLVLLVPGPEGFPGPSLALDCSASISIYGAENVANLTVGEPRISSREHQSRYLYVRPKPGFKGVSLVAALSRRDDAGGGVGDELEIAWFPLENSFPDTADWLQLIVEALTHTDYGRNQTPYREGLAFRAWITGFSKACFRHGNYSRVHSLQVWGYGASEWRFYVPAPRCKMITVQNKALHPPYASCPEPPTRNASVTHLPHNTSPTPPPRPEPASGTTTATPIGVSTTPTIETDTVAPSLPKHKWVVVRAAAGAVVGAIVVVAVSVAVVVSVRRRRQAAIADIVRLRARNTTETSGGREVINSLYEPLENFLCEKKIILK